MSTFTVDGREYELLSFDALRDMTLGEVEILEREGGLDVGDLASIKVTVKLVIAFIHVSMLRADPDASLAAARTVKLSILEQLAETIANTEEGDADPPTMPATDGHLASTSDLDISLGSSSVLPFASGE